MGNTNVQVSGVSSPDKSGSLTKASVESKQRKRWSACRVSCAEGYGTEAVWAALLHRLQLYDQRIEYDRDYTELASRQSDFLCAKGRFSTSFRRDLPTDSPRIESQITRQMQLARPVLLLAKLQ